MNRRSEWSRPFDVRTGALDVYQSLQRLEPCACVAAHFHDGPENGFVVSGTVTRWDTETGDRRYAAGTTFVTDARVTHATDNASALMAEQITLHALPRGATFAHSSSHAGLPDAAPGATTAARVCFAFESRSASMRTRHEIVSVRDRVTCAASEGDTLVTIVAGDLAIDREPIAAGRGMHIAERAADVELLGYGVAIISTIRSA